MRKNYEEFTEEEKEEEEEIVFILGTNFLSFPPSLRASGRVISSLVQGMQIRLIFSRYQVKKKKNTWIEFY